MKKQILLFLWITISLFGKAQQPFVVCFYSCNATPMWQQTNFEYDSISSYFYFDSTQTTNLWQIGKPMKTIFNAANSGQRALITDSTNNYPVNNVSSFVFKTIYKNYHPAGTGILFAHKFNTDSNKDGGTIEVSHDNGNTWINLINDPMAYFGSNMYTSNDTIKSLGNKPGFTGNSGGWKFVDFIFNVSQPVSDTILFKFTFASDSINTNKDGWMIDDLTINGLAEDISEIPGNNSISVFPNPASTKINFKQKITQPFTMIVYDCIGNKMFQTVIKENEPVDISDLTTGIYFVTFQNECFYNTKKIVIQ